MTFGELFYEFRIKKSGMSMRQFCKQIGIDSSYISRVERGIFPPPNTKSKILAWTAPLNLSEDEIVLLVNTALHYHVGRLLKNMGNE